MADEALDLKDDSFIFSVLFNDVCICTCCKNIVIATFLTTLLAKTSLVLVYLACLALVDRRLLVLAIKCASGESVSRFSFFGVFFLLLFKLVPLEKP